MRESRRGQISFSRPSSAARRLRCISPRIRATRGIGGGRLFKEDGLVPVYGIMVYIYPLSEHENSTYTFKLDSSVYITLNFLTLPEF